MRAALEEISKEKAALLKARPLSIGVIGFGKFGQFLARRFLSQGHQVSCLSRSDRRSEASEMGVEHFGGLGASDEEVLAKATDFNGGPAAFLSQDRLDVVIVAVSILSFEETVVGLPIELLGQREVSAGGRNNRRARFAGRTLHLLLHSLTLTGFAPPSAAIHHLIDLIHHPIHHRHPSSRAACSWTC